MEVRLKPAIAVLAVAITGMIACTPPPKGDKALPFEQLTLDNIVRWPDGRDYITVVGRGYPEEGQKAQEGRRRTARDGAVVAAQQKLIDQLKGLTTKDKIRDLLHSAEVAKIDYAYDDICTVTMRLPKDLLSEKRQTSWDAP